MKKNKKIEVEWTGEYPCLCYGKWILKIGGKDCSKLIPKSLRENSDMNTIGTYDHWHFENWQELWESYENGLSEDNWIEENKHWLKKLPVEESQYKDIFKAFNEKDWRNGSCGGCI